MRHDVGLAASPAVRSILEVEGRGDSPFFACPDGHAPGEARLQRYRGLGKISCRLSGAGAERGVLQVFQ